MTAPLVVVSTAACSAEAAERCARSVAREGLKHRYVAANEDAFTGAVRGLGPSSMAIRSNRSKIENLISVIADLPRDSIVVWLDGDDELTPGAAERVAAEYANDGWETWLTYGSFRRSDGVRDRAWHEPFGTRYPVARLARYEAWRASHLRTFRAGLFQSIPEKHLAAAYAFGSPQYFTTCDDRAIMLPMIEMAGERYSVIQDVLCVYNADHDQTMTVEQRAIETCDRLQIHGMRPLEPLKVRPW